MIKKLLVLCFALTSCVLSQTTIPEPIEQPEEVDMASNLLLGNRTVTRTHISGATKEASRSIEAVVNNAIEAYGNSNLYYLQPDSGNTIVDNIDIFYVNVPYTYTVTFSVINFGNNAGTFQYTTDGVSWITLGSIGGVVAANVRNYTFTVNAPVKGFRIHSSITFATYSGYAAFLGCSEVSVTADAWVSSQIKIRTSSGLVVLAEEPALSSALRYKDSGGLIKSLRLVATSDEMASPLRVRTSSGTKAVAKI